MADPSEPKIIIDSDWKAQAQKEKERLAAKEREAAAKQAAPRSGSGVAAGPGAAAGAGAQMAPGGAGGVGAAGGPGGEQYELPPADFRSLLETLVSQAIIYLGGYPDPQTGRAIVSLEHAKFHIDLLALLQEKTKGNLTPEEESDMGQVLNALRLQFVEISRAVAQMQAKAAMEAQAAAKGGPGAAPNLRLRTE